jgi:hypothetical protein
VVAVTAESAGTRDFNRRLRAPAFPTVMVNKE